MGSIQLLVISFQNWNIKNITLNAFYVNTFDEFTKNEKLIASVQCVIIE